MTMPPEPTPETPPPPPPAAPTPPTPPVDPQQAEIDRVVAREKDQAERKALAGVKEALGGLTVEEAAAKLKAANEADLAAMSEADRKLAEAEQATAAAATAQAEALASRTAADLARALLTASEDQSAINADMVDPAIELGMKVALESGIPEAVEHLRKTVPLFFEPVSEQGKPPKVPPPARTGAERNKAPAPTDEAAAAFEAYKKRNQPIQL